LRKLVVDVLEFEHLVIGDVRFGQQHIHVARHAACDRVNGIGDLDALFFEVVGQFAQRMLGLRDRHAVTRHDDHRARVFHDEGGIVRRALLDGTGLLRACSRCSRCAEAAHDDREERAVHALAHDVGKNRARRADQCAGDDERGIFEREADAGGRPPRIGVKHRDHDRHVRAADRDDQGHTDQEGEPSEREKRPHRRAV